jgi:hypothetical protein
MNLLFAALVIFAAAFYPHKARTGIRPARETQEAPARPAAAPSEMPAVARPGGAS